MAKRSNVFLMYHELERPGRSLSQTDPGYVRYIVTENDFRAQMEWINKSGFAGTSASAPAFGNRTGLPWLLLLTTVARRTC